MATVASLQAQARLKASVASADYSDSSLLVQINLAYNELASIIAAGADTYLDAQRVYISLAINSAFYTLPSDFMKLRQARVAYTTPTAPGDYAVASGYDLTEVSDVTVDEENISISNPIVDIVGSKIKIKPTPTAVSTNGLQLNYIARPSALVNSADTPVIPAEWHDLLAIYAAREVCLRFGKTEKWNMLQSAWLMGIDRMKKELAERDINKPIRFKTPYESGSGRGISELYG